ncbi:MAG: DNA-directed RNA polymerase subunit alpha [Candidatus Melainabacteria bacterium GWF2_37_15]|nr:MAG: DNA-directed RNA polymerase subunit alpha [Candidatus Melainabacteria bacterium GWF2_37_15]
MDLTIKCVNTTTDSDGSIYGKFVIEPLERGYGTTIGNSLRRVLLSSLEGAAVTAARIEGVTHEYTTMPGVVEDITDILLNMKGLIVKSDSPEPQSLRIDVDRKGPVYAGDIQLPAGVKVINPDWVICNLSDGGSMHSDIIIESGKGYVTTDNFKEDSIARSIDMLPIDAVYMPIKKVSYTVENTRVGEVTDYDKLIMEVWSNGSMDVNTALSKAANLLIEQFLPIANLTGQITAQGAAIVEEEEPEQHKPKIGIEELDLSVRAYNCLKRASINSLEELLEKSEHDLLNIKNFGKKSSDEVIERLSAFSLKLKPNPEGVEIE